jgi:hypothetical protein
MRNLKALAEELDLARRASVSTDDPLLRVAACDAWRRFRDAKRKVPEQASAAVAYYRLLLLGRKVEPRSSAGNGVGVTPGAERVYDL